MARGPVFLIGGGWIEAGFAHTYGPFVAAVDGGPIACVLVVDEDEDREAYFARSRTALESVGATDVTPVFVSPERPLQPADLEGVGGVLVGGGLTPAYYDAIVPSAGTWIGEAVAHGLPYAGFSAGAMIAPQRGIIGGWKLRQGDTDLVICSEDVAEDLEYLHIRDGLGLASVAIDVHASQYGTTTRLLHAVRAGRVMSGWAIDEDTALEIAADGTVTVQGLGSACFVGRERDGLTVSILGHGDRFSAS
jgi:cyanophycinase